MTSGEPTFHRRRLHSWDGFAVDIDTEAGPRIAFVSVCRYCGLIASQANVNRGGLGECPTDPPPRPPGAWATRREVRFPWWLIGR